MATSLSLLMLCTERNHNDTGQYNEKPDHIAHSQMLPENRHRPQLAPQEVNAAVCKADIQIKFLDDLLPAKGI